MVDLRVGGINGGGWSWNCDLVLSSEKGESGPRREVWRGRLGWVCLEQGWLRREHRSPVECAGGGGFLLQEVMGV